jgi:hypothetical protein
LGASAFTFSSLTSATRAEQISALDPPTRVARALGPTKFARLVPTLTPTPAPTDTPTPELTATSLPTQTPTLASTRRPTLPPTRASTPTNSPSPTPAILSASALSTGPCAPIPGESYYAFTLNSPPTDRPAAEHPDLNLGLRGYKPTTAYSGLLDLKGDTYVQSPQLAGLFADNRVPTPQGVYQVYDWNWNTNTRGDPLTYPEVTLLGAAVTPGETIHVPDSNTNIGLGYAALVLYAASNRLTLKYTGDDNVQRGYTLHLENVCVEPNLLGLYQRLNDAGRHQLPAVRVGQAIGRAASTELGIAIRDNGTFMDPRSRKDWWRGH